jgi:hypothetical protein
MTRQLTIHRVLKRSVNSGNPNVSDIPESGAVRRLFDGLMRLFVNAERVFEGDLDELEAYVQRYWQMPPDEFRIAFHGLEVRGYFFGENGRFTPREKFLALFRWKVSM